MNKIVNKKYDIGKYGFLADNLVKKLPPTFENYYELIELVGKNKPDKFYTEIESITDIANKNKNKNKSDYYKDNVYKLNWGIVKSVYSIFTILSHYYIWACGEKKCKKTIPIILGGYWYWSAKRLGLPCVLTHAAVDLYNWELKDKNEPFSLDNLKTIYTMTGNEGEEWFYLNMIAIEGEWGYLLPEIISFDPNNVNNVNKLDNLLSNISNSLTKSTKIIKRMREKCSPEFFFGTLRIFLGGSANDVFEDKGIKLEGIDETIKYKGGSAAQSSVFQALDIFFNVKHVGHGKKFLDEMIDYMPEMHANYLRDLRNLHSKNRIQDLVIKNNKLKVIYDKCLEQLAIFRGAHLSIVHDYIIKFIRKDNKDDKDNNKDNNIHGAKGTGGTLPDEFLGEVIRNVNNAKINKKQHTQGVLLLIIIMAWYIWHLWHSLH